MDTIKDFRVQVSVKNNNILKRIEDLGYTSVAPFCRDYKLNGGNIGDLINLKSSPLSVKGLWFKHVQDLAMALGVLPEELFSEEQLEGFDTNKSFIEMNKEEIQAMQLMPSTVDPLKMIADDSSKRQLEKMLATIPKRLKLVLTLRFGLEGEVPHTLEEVGKILKIEKERVRQIEAKALRMLRHPTRTEGLDLEDIVLEET